MSIKQGVPQYRYGAGGKQTKKKTACLCPETNLGYSFKSYKLFAIPIQILRLKNTGRASLIKLEINQPIEL
jgi:hypothetical protein